MRHVSASRSANSVSGGGVKERDHLQQDLSVYGRITLKQVLEKPDEKLWTGLISLRTGTSGGLL